MAGLHKRNVGHMQAAARCGAKTRSGAACQAPKIAGGKRCRMHGGKGSGAPKGNRNAYKNGLHTRVMKERKREMRDFVRQAKAAIAEVDASIPLE